MHAYRRHHLAGLLTVVAAVLAMGSAHPAGATLTHQAQVSAQGPICPSGTNWDNILHICR